MMRLFFRFLRISRDIRALKKGRLGTRLVNRSIRRVTNRIRIKS